MRKAALIAICAMGFILPAQAGVFSFVYNLSARKIVHGFAHDVRHPRETTRRIKRGLAHPAHDVKALVR